MSGPRVRIVQLGADALAALAAGDLDAAAALTPVPLTPWLVTDDVIGIWRRRSSQVLETPADLAWVTGLVWDEDLAKVVGRAGFHAAPDADGMVEVGYEVDPAYRRRGHARAALDALLARARSEESVRVLRVTVSPDNTASLGLLAQYPFAANGEQWDDEDGLELVLEMDV